MDVVWSRFTPSKLNGRQARHLVELHDAQTHSAAELAGLFRISVATV